MPALLSSLSDITMIIIVVLFFNFMIFVHELGHFLAGRWRGAYINRFQIWFGKPLWKKTINGVEWGIGWIPAGGFVSLPQMGDMEGLEGEIDPEVLKTLKPLKPLDKIIIAFAGPLFSFLLACFFALIVWAVGTKDVNLSTTVGYVTPDSPAATAGIIAGDKITAIDGQAVTKWAGNMEGVSELIALSEKPEITFTLEREQADGKSETLTLVSQFTLPETGWWQRGSMRQVGISPAMSTTVGEVSAESPAAQAGLKEGDIIIAANGTKVFSPIAISKIVTESPICLSYKRDGAEATTTLTPQVPSNWKGREGSRPLMGFNWARDTSTIITVHPSPMEQISNSFKWMGDTLAKVTSPGSNVGMEHMSGPVGIGNALFSMLGSEGGWQMVLWFAVIINVNLAVLNLLPLPIVDGGHVVLGIIEIIVGRPVGGKILAFIQTGFVFILMAFFLYVTFKDVGDLVGGGSDEPKALPAPIFKQE